MGLQVCFLSDIAQNPHHKGAGSVDQLWETIQGYGMRPSEKLLDFSLQRKLGLLSCGYHKSSGGQDKLA